MSTDKEKIAKVISDMLGMNTKNMTPEQAINSSMKTAKSLPPDLLVTYKKMIQLAKDNGIQIHEELVMETWASQKSHPDGPGKGKYLGDMSGAEHKDAASWHKDQYKKSKSKSEKVDHLKLKQHHEDAANSWSRRKSTQEAVDIMKFNAFIKKKTAPHHDNIEDQEDTETGSSMQPDSTNDDDQLRRRKIDYRMTEEIETDEDENDESDEDSEELSDKELDAIAKEIDDEDDILDLYDEDEISLVDDETGEKVEETIDESTLMEVMSRSERYKARMRFMKSKAKRERKVKIALHKRSDSKTLNKRAKRLAIQLIKERIMKKKMSEMSVSEKERVEKIMSRRKKSIDRLAMRLIPRIRKIENERLIHTQVTQGEK